MDQLNLCDDVLKVIGEYASIKIETKKYKSKKNNNKMKINKIKYKCYVCGALNNKNQYWFNQYRCKNINKCIEKCPSRDYCIEKHKKFIKSLKYSEIYGYNWNNILNHNMTVFDLHRKFKLNRLSYDSNIINKFFLNFDNASDFREKIFSSHHNNQTLFVVDRSFGGIFRDQRLIFQ